MPTLEEILRIKEGVEAELLRRPGVGGVDVGFKYVGGRRTEEIAIRVFVRKKLSDVPEAERIPETIGGVRTDVIERTFVPIIDFNRYDPIQGGCNIGLGTLGAVVKDQMTGAPALLTTFHGQAAVGTTICQPNAVICDPATSANYVGNVIRSTLNSTADATICSLSNRNWSNWILEIGPTGAPAEATMGMAVRKGGITTGLTYGDVDGVGLTVNAIYPNIGTVTLTNQIQIGNDISRNPKIAAQGDSGSLVITGDFHWVRGVGVVGLLILADEAGTVTIATPIRTVLAAMAVDLYEWSLVKLSPWPFPSPGWNPAEVGEWVRIFGGVASDGGGWVVTPGGIVKRVPPWDPGPLSTQGSEAIREIMSGLAVSEVAGTISDRSTRNHIRKAALELVIRQAQRLLATDS